MAIAHVIDRRPSRGNNQGMSMATIETNDVVTTAEFAEAVGLSIDTIKSHCQRKSINAVKVGGKAGVWVISKSELVRFKNERRSRGRPKKQT